MINIEEGRVEEILWADNQVQGLEVMIGGKKEKAVNYLCFNGAVSPGNRVFLNTTAVRLNLGSGGYHFVILNTAASPYSSHNGHIIKMRYTPLQFKVKAWEEEKEASSSMLKHKYKGLDVPVVIGELHSMLEPFVRTLNSINDRRKIVYIMCDSASLSLPFSRTVSRLKGGGMLAGTITYGQAFGGDLECVNIYTALIAAREELKADLILIAPGPGVVGTGNRYGYSGAVQGEHIERVHKLGGIPVVIPRISFADPRPRHRGLSHHTLTALGELSTKRAYLPLPLCDGEQRDILSGQLNAAGILEKHDAVTVGRETFSTYLRSCCDGCRTMGRGPEEDPVFFETVCAAACFVEDLLTGKHGKKENTEEKIKR